MAEATSSKAPELKNMLVNELVSSKRTPAKGGPRMALKPLQQLISPKVVDKLSSPSRSTKMIDVKDMYGAVGRSLLAQLQFLNGSYK